MAAGHPETCAAAQVMLEAGGNAFDAAVSAGFASAVCEPMLTSLGGGGFLLARTSEGREVVFDFFVDAPGRGLPARELEPHFHPVTVHFPGSDQVFNTGMGSVAVPGTLAGYLHVHEQLGRLPLAEVVAPAIRLAAGGHPLHALQAYVVELLEPILTQWPDGRALYAPGGTALATGDHFANPDLAAFLGALASGETEGFYSGELAERVADDMAEGRGLLTAADLGAYRVVERRPLEVAYRGRRVLTNPPPSFGGTLVALSLDLLERHDPDVAPWGSGEHLLRLAETYVEVDRVRATGVTRGTTHVSVSDGEGNVAAMTTSNGEGSGYVVPGTGVMLNNMMGEDDLHPDGFHASPPGMRVGSMMSPTVVMDGSGGGVDVVLGSGGSKRIRTAILQVVSNVVDFGMGLERAVTAPRAHWDGEVLQVEPGYSLAALDRVAGRYPTNEWGELNLYFGGVHAVRPSGEAGGDPRRGGATCVVSG